MDSKIIDELVLKEKNRTEKIILDIALILTKKWRYKMKNIKEFLDIKGPSTDPGEVIYELGEKFNLTTSKSKKIYVKWREEYILHGYKNEVMVSARRIIRATMTLDDCICQFCNRSHLTITKEQAYEIKNLKERGSLKEKEIAKITGVTVMQVSSLVRTLRKSGFLDARVLNRREFMHGERRFKSC